MEYCRIDRASELLNCKISDLLHWLSLGVISPALMLDKCRCSAYPSTDLAISRVFDNSVLSPITLTESSQINREIELQENWGIEFKKHTKSNIYQLFGCWHFYNSKLNFMALSFGSVTVSLVDMFFYPVGENYLSGDSPEEYLTEDEMLTLEFQLISTDDIQLTLSDIFISRYDIELIHQNIGNEIEDRNDGFSPYINQKRPHPKQTEAKKTKEIMFSGISKALVRYPYSEDERHPFRNYVRNGKIIKSKLRELLKQYSASLFPNECLPVNSDDAIDKYINEYIDHLTK